MFSEENIMHTIVGIGLLAAFLGTVAGCLWITYRDECEMKKRRAAFRRGVTNFARKQAVLAVSSEVIRKG